MIVAGEIQAAIYEALSTAQCCHGRIYDTVPETFSFPYHLIGDEQVIDDSSMCGGSNDVFCDIHTYSRPDTGSRAEVKALRRRAHDAIMAISHIEGFRLIGVFLETARNVTDPDNVTKHDIMTFKFQISEA